MSVRASAFRHTARPVVLAAAVGGALLVLTACQDPAAQAEAQAAAQAQAGEAAADKAAVEFDAAFAAENWPLAKAHGDLILARHPDTAAAARIAPLHEQAGARAESIREDKRLAGLWTYNVEPVTGGTQLSAAIYTRDRVDSDGSGARPVRLIFRDHPSWGRSSYLVMEAGDFDCYGACRVAVTVDSAAPVRMAANRPDTDEAIAMFIDDERALWRMLDGAKALSVEYPVKAGGTRTAVFEVGGLDRARLAGWK
ncbi:hypothetical protein [Luteimonas sp. MC1825]|uniref:hypothetical protein n=1 Tax=Luteimonas sp. MC1825 TaxID=2761107 RepID=UPI00161A7B19|nr:hypothetical protein [Luteimonas sp. MC1825]MBB6600239.1 hypothetical protein [Luteimonas sp. MC1825]QOC89599.1 hypothetical protein IDM46_11975 [Luteimonas sp. MC1825]